MARGLTVLLVLVCLTSLGSETSLAQGLESGEPLRITVQAVQFTGASSLLSAEEIAELEAAVVGQTLDFAGLQALADWVSQTLRAKGRILARAYLPPQDVTEGVVQIAVTEGSVEAWRFELSEDVRIRQERLEAFALRAAEPGEPLTRQELERALLLMTDQAGVAARARLESGSRPDTTVVVVEVDEGPAVSGAVSLNNYGAFTTGSNQVSLSLEVNDALAWGERFSFGATLSSGVRMLRAGTSAALGAGGARWNGRLTSMAYTVVEGDGAAANLTGTSQAWHLDLEYPFIRSRAVNVRGTAGYDFRAMTDLAAGIVTKERHVRSAGLGLSGDAAGGGGYTTWGVSYLAGESQVLQGADPDVAGPYGKIAANFSRVQSLGGRYSLTARASGQWASANLDSSEKLALGGPSGIRAYPVSEASGDTGWAASLELRHDLAVPEKLGGVQLAAFVDAGRIQLYVTPPAVIPTATGQNSYSLAGMGLAATWRPSAQSSMQLGWARALGDNPGGTIHGTHADGGTQDQRIWLQATFSF